MRGALCRVRVRLYSHNRYMEGGIEEETGRWVASVGLSARSGHVDLGGNEGAAPQGGCARAAMRSSWPCGCFVALESRRVAL